MLGLVLIHEYRCYLSKSVDDGVTPMSHKIRGNGLTERHKAS